MGAKGGANDLLKLHSYINVSGFEPNPAEFKNILNPSKNSRLNAYSSATYFQKAMSDQQGTMPLFLTRHSSYASMLQANWNNHEKHVGRIQQFELWKNALIVEEKIMVETTTLDHFTQQNNIQQIHFLKLDTQGTELQVLKGGQSLFAESRIHVIKCEIAFYTVYQHQCLFSDIDFFLRNNGFELIDIQWPQDQCFEKTKGSMWELPHPKGAGGEAIYLLNYENRPGIPREEIIKSVLIMAEMGYYSTADYLRKQFDLFPAKEFNALIKYFSYQPLKARLREFTRQWIPPALWPYLKKLANLFHY